MRSYSICRSDGHRANKIASYFGSGRLFFAFHSLMVMPVWSYTSSARTTRLTLFSWMRCADTGSTARSISCSACAPCSRAMALYFSRASRLVSSPENTLPSIRASRYSPVPPHTMGILPRDKISCNTGSASSTYFPTEKSSAGSAMSII